MIASHGILLANREMEKVVSGEAPVGTRKFFYSDSSIVSLSHSLFIFVYVDTAKSTLSSVFQHLHSSPTVFYTLLNI